MYLTMSPTDVLDHIVSLNSKAKHIIEVGSYYCGWAKYLSDKMPQATIYALQSPSSDKLNHIKDTSEGELSEFDILGWKKHMKGQLDKKYHQYYDFNLYAQEVNSRSNIVGVLTTSPPTHWQQNYDICTIALTKDPNENYKQYCYWRTKGNPGSVLLLAAYNLLPGDNYEGEFSTRKELIDAIKKMDNVTEFDHEHIILHND